MNRTIQKLIVAAMSFLACCAFQAKACDANFHLLLVSEWGATVDNISIRDTNGDYLISGETLESAQVIPYDLVVTPGRVYHFHGHETGYGMDFDVDFTPTSQEFLLDVIGYPFITQEWGDPISPPTTYTITTSNSPSGGGTTSGGGTKNCGSIVTVTATPASGYTFVDWTEGDENAYELWDVDTDEDAYYSSGPKEVSTNANYTFTVTGARKLTAHFSPGCTGTFELQVGGIPLDWAEVKDQNGNRVWYVAPLPALTQSDTFTAVAGQHYTFDGFRADTPRNAEYHLEFFPFKTANFIGLDAPPFVDLSTDDLCQ